MAIKDDEEKNKLLLDLLNRFSLAEEAHLHFNNYKYTYAVSNFRPIELNEMLREEVPSANGNGTKSAFSEGNQLLYKIARGDPTLIRSTLESNGFHCTDRHSWNILWTNTYPKAYLYEGLNEYQRINHFPGSVEVTRKDKMCENIVQKQKKYGKSMFDIIPDTYVLPNEFDAFCKHFSELKRASVPNVWIVKPNSLSRGRGIYLVTSPNDVHLDEQCIVSRYVANPLLINGVKFDIRIYVAITSLDPLRIYVYNEGLARFCTEKYSLSETNNVYSHLTNYSINKKNNKFIQNKQASADNIGQKWSLTALNKYLQEKSIDTEQVWLRIYDLIIRTMIACEPALHTEYKKFSLSRSNCFELLGFDVLLDDELRPWLIEVNLSPSLACESPLDHLIKSNLIADLFTLIGIRQFDRRKDGMFKNKLLTDTIATINKRKIIIKGKSLDKNIDEEVKMNGIYKKLSQIQQKHREILIDTLEENERKRNFIRIYPSKGTDHYDNLFEASRINHKAIYKLLYDTELQFTEEEFTRFKKHTISPIITHKVQRYPQTVNCKKILITGDDILIEYIERLTLKLKNLQDLSLKSSWVKSVESFITHEVWRNDLGKKTEGLHLWQRLNDRLTEMKEKRRKMAKAPLSRAASGPETKTMKEQKQNIIQSFSVNQLEEMLRSSTRNTAYSVVICLIPPSSPGILYNITAWINTFSKTLMDCEGRMPQAEEMGFLPFSKTPYRGDKMTSGKEVLRTNAHLASIKYFNNSFVIEEKTKVTDNSETSKSFFQSAQKITRRINTYNTSSDYKKRWIHRSFKPIGSRIE